ncbi:ribonuclease H-like domain-containing protein [Tanacetum coccineum]
MARLIALQTRLVVRTIDTTASRHWPNHQLDVKNAFLHGDLSETVYMHQPPGFRDSVHPDYGTNTAYLLLYVDDIVLTAFFESLLQQIIISLHQEFVMTDLGSPNYFLGHIWLIVIHRTSHYTKTKLGKMVNPFNDIDFYIAVLQDLTVSYFTDQIFHMQFQQCVFICRILGSRIPPTHKKDLTLCSRYIGLWFAVIFFIYYRFGCLFNADWAGCPTTRRSTSGYCVFLGNNLLSWSSKCQPTLSRSSAEAEYRGVINAVAETCWLRNLLRKLHTPLTPATLVYCDNVNAVYLSCNPVQHQRTKHIEIDIHFVRDLVVVVCSWAYMDLPGPSIGGRSFEPAAMILLCIWLSVEDVLFGVDMMNE